MKYSLLIIIAIILSSCKDKTNATNYCKENPGGCQSVLEGKKYFAFKLGSWWVYEEENSGKRDSVYVSQSYINQNNYDFDIRTYSTLHGYTYHYWPVYASGAPNCSEHMPNAGRCLLMKRSKGKTGDFVGESYCFFVNFIQNDFLYVTGNIYFDNNKIVVKDIFEAFTLNSFVFENTVVIHELNNYMEGRQPTNHYFSKNTGLVRIELLDSNQVWNLINYHIQH